MKQKRLMLLGGIRYLLPVIEAAHKEGYYVITADYLPDNIAHKFSDEYVNVSIIDREAVLRAATDKKIDGIMSFGVDPGVVSAAYVQTKLGLPAFGPLDSVEILQNKDRFRTFLQENGFNVPKSKGYSSVNDALADAPSWTYPVIVKPTDSAGSKGVSRVDDPALLENAVEHAFRHSLSGHVIIEDFIEKLGCSSDSDSFLENGILTFVSFSAQRFDPDAANPYTPSAYTWPSTFTEGQQACLRDELQRLFSLLHMRTGVYNIEARIGLDGTPYIMEATPRGGGNRLSEMLRFATGSDMITASVRDCVGDGFEPVRQNPFDGCWAEIILHADNDGRFGGLHISDAYRPFVVEEDLWVSMHDEVRAFRGANDAIGTLVLQFPDQDTMEYAITHQREWLTVEDNENS